MSGGLINPVFSRSCELHHNKHVSSSGRSNAPRVRLCIHRKKKNDAPNTRFAQASFRTAIGDERWHQRHLSLFWLYLPSLIFTSVTSHISSYSHFFPPFPSVSRYFSVGLFFFFFFLSCQPNLFLTFVFFCSSYLPGKSPSEKKTCLFYLFYVFITLYSSPISGENTFVKKKDASKDPYHSSLSTNTPPQKNTKKIPPLPPNR